MSVSQGELLRVFHELEVEIHHRGHTIALRYRGLVAYLPIRNPDATVPIKQVRHVIEYLMLEKAVVGQRLPDLYGKPSLPPG